MKGIIRENMYLRAPLIQVAVLVQLLSTIICSAFLLSAQEQIVRNIIKLIFLCLEFAFIALLEEWLTGNHTRNINNGFYQCALTSGTNRRQFIAAQAMLYFGTLAFAVAMVAICQWILTLFYPELWNTGGFSLIIGFALFAFTLDWFNAPLVFSIHSEDKQTIITFITGLVVVLLIAIPVFVQIGNTLGAGGTLGEYFESFTVDTAALSWLFPLVCVIAACTAIGGGLVWYGWINRGPTCK